MVYDRERTVMGYFMQSDDTISFWKIKHEIQGPRGVRGVKVYRWAKRTGDFEFSVCFDRAPKESIDW